MKISSAANERFKRLVKWRKQPVKARQDDVFLLEGLRAIAGIVQAGGVIRELWWSLPSTDVPDDWSVESLFEVTPTLMQRLSSQATPPGCLAVVQRPASVTPDAQQAALVCVGVQDPGNLGTVLRSAAAFAWPQVVLVGGCDPWHPRVLQASAGVLPLLTVAVVDASLTPADLQLAPENLVSLVVNGGQQPDNIAPKLARPWIAIGNEAHGLPESWRVGRAMTLPMAGPVESLNAAMAATIAAFVLRPDRSGSG